MDIGYGDCVALGGHRCYLTLLERDTRYVCTYGMHALYGADIIQALQEFQINACRLLSKMHT